MAHRVWNFNPGPAVLPLPVLEKIRMDIPDFKSTGMTVMELSHRSGPYEEIHNRAISLLVELLKLPDNYRILFLQGGASLQFAMVPMNLLGSGQTADYVITGIWSKKAFEEAKLLGRPEIAGTSADVNFNRIPEPEEMKFNPEASYVHLTSNNTVVGTQWKVFPDTGTVPIVADMSSDILSRRLALEPFGLIYAGAQKNLGPSGVTVVIIRDDILGKCRKDIPTMLRYGVHAENNSLYNTPPVLAIYIMKLVMEWVKEKGGLAAVEKENSLKGKLLYSTLDSLSGFYRGFVANKECRSLMNATFRLPSEDMEKQFITEAMANDFIGLKGHRSLGGIRVSMYNAMPFEGIKALTGFMKDFAKRKG